MKLLYKKIQLVAFVAVCATTGLLAQQEAMQTQFMYNKVAFNPGYAGSFESPTLTVIDRHQWLGLDGAPNTQAITFTQPLLSNNFGLGFNLQRNSISIHRTLSLEVSYAYRLALPRSSYLGIGLMANMRQIRQDWTDPRLVSSQPIELDGAIPGDVRTKFLPNFGFGLYYTATTWYAGVGVPRLVKNNIDLADASGLIVSESVQHYNAMGGMTLRLGEGVHMTPQMLIKYTRYAPVDVDANVMFDFQKKFNAGLTYRMGGNNGGVGESIDLMTGMQATKNLFFMLSYDLSLTRLRRFPGGSFEATLRWWFQPPEGEEAVNPNRPF
jgi:type IX secretion system PorP/SprF family membrane protein